MFTETDATLRITIQPTNKCNLKCSYCYQTNKGHTDLTFGKVQRFLDKVFAHDNAYFNGFLREDYDNVILDFIGGEATLNMPLIEKTVRYFIQSCIDTGNMKWLHGMSIWLQTNGTTYFHKDVQAFLKKYHAKTDLPITVDGSKECHDACRVYHNGTGSYDDVAKAVTAYMDTYKKQPNTKITLSPDNVHAMFDAIKNMIDLGYTGCRISCTQNEHWPEEADAVFEQQLEQFFRYLEENNLAFNLYPWSDMRNYRQGIRCASCGANGNAICIACDGKLFLCQAFSDICDMQGKPTMSIGDVEHGITDVGIKWLREIPKRNAAVAKNSRECKDCPCNSICEYCPAVDYAYNVCGDKPHLFTANCRKSKAAYRLLQEHLERRKNNGEQQL